jgi:predicted transcriptional regulator
MHIVRYADDFKIFCRNHADAVNTFIAVKQWLKDRLKLDINDEKSAVINLKRRYSDYLGFKLKVCENGGKFKVKSHMSDKAKAKAKGKISECVTAMKNPAGDKEQYKAVQSYNATVAGMHNYYQYATHVSIDFSEIAYGVKKQLSNRLKELTRNGKLERGFIKEKYGRSKELRFLNGHALIPVAYVRVKYAIHKKKIVNR